MQVTAFVICISQDLTVSISIFHELFLCNMYGLVDVKFYTLGRFDLKCAFGCDGCPPFQSLSLSLSLFEQDSQLHPGEKKEGRKESALLLLLLSSSSSTLLTKKQVKLQTQAFASHRGCPTHDVYRWRGGPDVSISAGLVHFRRGGDGVVRAVALERVVGQLVRRVGDGRVGEVGL